LRPNYSNVIDHKIKTIATNDQIDYENKNKHNLDEGDPLLDGYNDKSTTPYFG